MVRRIDYLDGLRGMAALIVVFYHLMLGFYRASHYPESLLHTFPLQLLVNGNFAVVVFLLLSGYVIGLKDSTPSLSTVVETIVKRFFRFVMPILATHLVVVVVLSLGWYWNREAAEITLSDSWLGMMWQIEPSVIDATSQAILSVFRGFSRDIVYNSSIWTMPFFFLGPLGLMSFLFLVRPAMLRIGLLGLGIVLLIKTYYWPILFGYLLARLFRNRSSYPAWIHGLLLAAFVVFGNYPYSVSIAQTTPFYRWLPTVSFMNTTTLYQVLGVAALLLLLASWTRLQQLFSGQWILFLGTISFSLYLFHVLIINTVTSGLFLILYAITDYKTAFGISLLASLPLIMAGSVLLYRYAEVPSQPVARSVLQWGIWLFQGLGKKLNRN
jgi:peptidoglycan/LPS O-acetylase OafA/YrhL